MIDPPPEPPEEPPSPEGTLRPTSPQVLAVWGLVGLVAGWLFGSGNVLVWVIAVAASATAYVVAPLRASDG